MESLAEGVDERVKEETSLWNMLSWSSPKKASNNIIGLEGINDQDILKIATAAEDTKIIHRMDCRDESADLFDEALLLDNVDEGLLVEEDESSAVETPRPIDTTYTPTKELIPKDWMMSFDSPITLQTANNASKPNQTSLLDVFEPQTTPKTSLKYCQLDLERLQAEETQKYESEGMIAQLEITELSEDKIRLEGENRKLRETLGEWEVAVKTMLAEREREKMESSKSQKVLESRIDDGRLELEKKEEEMQLVSLKWKQLQLEVADLKQISDRQKQDLLAANEDLSKAETRFNSLRSHAEGKLEEANIEIARVRQGFENEIVAAKARVSRLETLNNTLTKSLETKASENEELMTICDELEKQLLE